MEKLGASIGFQLIDIFRIMEDNSLSLNEKKQKILEYQEDLKKPKTGIAISSNKGQNVKNGYYVFGNIDKMNYDSLMNTKKYVDSVLSSFTCEGEMKMSIIIAGYDSETHSIKYNFSLADKIYDYAMEHGKDMRGHTLVWHKHEPEILDKYIEDRLGCSLEDYQKENSETFFEKRKKLTKDFLAAYIKTVGEHFPNCYCWDVLNEIVTDIPFEEKRDNIRHSKWFEYLGEDFYIDVLEIARDNLPKGTKLFYNDYGEQYPQKRKAILEIIEKVKKYEKKTGKVILDGIGLQSHYDLNVTEQQLEEIYHDFSTTGKEIQVTEVDIAPGIDEEGNHIPYNLNNIEQYAKIWSKIFELSERYDVQAFTGWGVNDDLSWFHDIGCTMVGEDGIPKDFARDFLEKSRQTVSTQYLCKNTLPEQEDIALLEKIENEQNRKLRQEEIKEDLQNRS